MITIDYAWSAKDGYVFTFNDIEIARATFGKDGWTFKGITKVDNLPAKAILCNTQSVEAYAQVYAIEFANQFKGSIK